MSIQRKKSKRMNENKFNGSEVSEGESSVNLNDSMTCVGSSMNEIVGKDKFHRQHMKRKYSTSNFFKRMNTLTVVASSTKSISYTSEKAIDQTSNELAKPDLQIQDVLKNHETYVRVKNMPKQNNRNHREDSRKLSALFSDKILLQENNYFHGVENLSKDVTARDLRYLPMSDILNYQGEVTSNPKLIERRLLNKMRKAFMGK